MTNKKAFSGTAILLVIMLASLFALEFAGISLAKSKDDDSFTVVEKDILTIQVHANGSSEETEELQTLMRSQLVIDKESQADIPFLSNLQKVEVLEAYSITPQGKKIPVASNAIRTVEDDNSEGKLMYSDMKHKIIIFPNVTVGSRTYYKVVTKTMTPLFPGHYFSRLWFSAGTQWAHSEININHDPKIHLQVDTKGVKGGRIADGPSGEVRYRINYKSSGLKPYEPNQIHDAELSPYVHISSFKNQLEMAHAYEVRAKDKSFVTPTVQKLADDITKGINDPLEQSRTLYNYVSKNIRYVAIYFGAGGVVPHYADEIIQNKYGDCKDKTVLLIALLKAKGIDASSADINSGNAYSIPKLAVLGPFNHVITYLPKWDIYLDPTAERAPFGVLPYYELDKPTILTGLKKIGHTPKPSSKQNLVATKVVMKIDDDGKISGTSHTNYLGAEGIRPRFEYEGVDTSYGDNLVREKLRAARLYGSGTFIPTNVTDLDKRFELDTNFNLEPIANLPGPGAISIPMGLAPREIEEIAFSKQIDNPTKPVVCRSRTLVDVQQIEFPKVVRVGNIPKGVYFNEGDINYKSTYNKKGNEVEIRRELTIQHSSMVCDIYEIKRWNKFIGVLQKDLRGQVFYE
jgi:transglutaminase-like putative cysteine protease